MSPNDYSNRNQLHSNQPQYFNVNQYYSNQPQYYNPGYQHFNPPHYYSNQTQYYNNGNQQVNPPHYYSYQPQYSNQLQYHNNGNQQFNPFQYLSSAIQHSSLPQAVKIPKYFKPPVDGKNLIVQISSISDIFKIIFSDLAVADINTTCLVSKHWNDIGSEFARKEICFATNECIKYLEKNIKDEFKWAKIRINKWMINQEIIDGKVEKYKNITQISNLICRIKEKITYILINYITNDGDDDDIMNDSDDDITNDIYDGVMLDTFDSVEFDHQISTQYQPNFFSYFLTNIFDAVRNYNLLENLTIGLPYTGGNDKKYNMIETTCMELIEDHHFKAVLESLKDIYHEDFRSLEEILLAGFRSSFLAKQFDYSLEFIEKMQLIECKDDTKTAFKMIIEEFIDEKRFDKVKFFFDSVHNPAIKEELISHAMELCLKKLIFNEFMMFFKNGSNFNQSVDESE